METETGVAGVEIAFDASGLVPCVTQDWSTGEVLTLAYMNREALDRTLASGEVHFWSRSRGELWRKGETSGNTQRLRALRYDCDEDALLAMVEPAGRWGSSATTWCEAPSPPLAPATLTTSRSRTWR